MKTLFGFGPFTECFFKLLELSFESLIGFGPFSRVFQVAGIEHRISDWLRALYRVFKIAGIEFCASDWLRALARVFLSCLN